MDLARAIFVVAAFVASVRARYRLGIVLAVACVVILACEVLLPFLFPTRPERVEFFFGAVFLGPTTLPHAPPVGATAFAQDPIHHVVSAGLAVLGAQRALRRGAELPPNGEASRNYDRAGLRFLALAVILGLLATSGLMAHVIGKGDF